MYRHRYRHPIARHCDDVTKGQKHRLLDYTYLQRKLTTEGILAVLKELSEARKASPHDEDLKTVEEVFQLSQDALHRDPKQLPTHLLSRVPAPSGDVTSLLAQCREQANLYLVTRIPGPLLTPVGGPLVKCIPVSPDTPHAITDLIMTSDGQHVIAATEQELVVVDVMGSAGAIRTIRIQRALLATFHLCCEDSVIVVLSTERLQAFHVNTGEQAWVLDTDINYYTMACSAGSQSRILCIFRERHVTLHDARSGRVMDTIPIPASANFTLGRQRTPPVGNERHVVTTDKTSRRVIVLDIVEKVIANVRVMEHLCVNIQNAVASEKVDDGTAASEENIKGEKSTGGDTIENEAPITDGTAEDDNSNNEADSDSEDDDREEKEEEEEEDEDEEGEEEEDEEKEEKEKVYKQFTVEGLVLSGAGNHVICFSVENDHLYILDISTLDTVRVYKGQGIPGGTYHNQVTPDGRFLYYCSAEGTVCIWDLQAGRFSTPLPGYQAIRVVTVDGRTLVTVSGSKQIRVWDLDRGPHGGQRGCAEFRDHTVLITDQGNKLVLEKQGVLDDTGKASNAKYAKEIAACLPLSSPRYVLLLVCDNGGYQLRVYDVALDKVVRKGHIGKIESRKTLRMSHVRGTHVVFKLRERHKLVDVDKMAVILTFQGRSHYFLQSAPIVLLNSSEILTVTKGGRHLKLYSLTTGKVSRIITQHQQDRAGLSVCRRLQVNEAKTLVGFTGFGNSPGFIHVFDLTTFCMLCTVGRHNVEPDYTIRLLMLEAITNDGIILLIGSTKDSSRTLQEEDSEESSVDCMIVYDLHKQRVVRHFEDPDKDREFSWNHLLNQNRLLVTKDYGNSLVFDIRTGEMVTRIPEHGTSLEWYQNTQCPIMVSYESFDHQRFFHLWRKNDATLLASFQSDEQSLGTGRMTPFPGHTTEFLATPHEGDTPVVFHVRGKQAAEVLGHHIPLAAYPQFYQGQELHLTVRDFNADKGNDDDNDPDHDDADCKHRR